VSTDSPYKVDFMIQDKNSSTAIVLACSHSKDVNTGNWIGYHNYK